MVKSKQKREKPEETTAEFVRRVSQKPGKPNGLKQHFTRQKRRH